MGDNTTHSKLSPSARHRWGNCPGSVREEARFPESPGGPAALDGTRTHAILEHCVKTNITGPLHLIGTTFEYDYEGAKDSFIVDADRANRVNLAIEYIRERVKEEGTTAIPERRVFPDGFLDSPDCSGTVDIQIPGKDVYEITDYKDGMSPVSAKDNPQLELYALGALAELEPGKYPKKIRMTIIQPKLALKGMPAITSHEIPVSELLSKVPVIKAEIAATEDPNAPLVPGDSQCKYCRAKGTCPAIAGKAMEEVGLMFQPIPSETATPVPSGLPPFLIANPTPVSAGPELDLAQQAANKNPATMDNRQLRQILEAAPLVKQFLQGVEDEVERRLQAGQEVPGFKLVRGRGSRKWALPEEEIAKKLKTMGLPKDSLYEHKLITPAQAEKVTWEKDGETKQLSERQLKKMQTEYVVQQPGKPTVAPEADSREAIVMNAAPMFSAIETPVQPVAGLPAFLQPRQ